MLLRASHQMEVDVMFKRVWGHFFRAGADMCLVNVSEKNAPMRCKSEELRGREWRSAANYYSDIAPVGRQEPGCNSDNPNEQRQKCTQFTRGLHASLVSYKHKFLHRKVMFEYLQTLRFK